MQARLSLHTWRLAGDPNVAQLSKATKLIVKVPGGAGQRFQETGQSDRHEYETLCLLSGEAIFKSNSQHLFWRFQINTSIR